MIFNGIINPKWYYKGLLEKLKYGTGQKYGT